MSWSIIISLISLGIVLILLEIFLLPGLFTGIIGLICIAVGVYFSYDYGAMSGNIVLCVTLAVIVLLLYFLFKSKTWKKLSLNDTIDSKVNEVDSEKLKKGDIGICISKLSPSGKAVFENDIYEVHSLSGVIDNETKVVVEKIDGYKIYVNPIK